jgi:hypothetical protein
MKFLALDLARIGKSHSDDGDDRAGLIAYR